MATQYPIKIDTTTIELPTVIDNFTPVNGETFNRLRDAIIAIETELGVKPATIFTTVRARLDDLSSELDTLATEFSTFVSGSGGPPGGFDAQVQFNDGGIFAGSASFKFDKTAAKVLLGSSASIAFGSSPAASGQLAFTANNFIAVRNHLGTGDAQLISTGWDSTLGNFVSLGIDNGIPYTSSKSFDTVRVWGNQQINIGTSTGNAQVTVKTSATEITKGNFAIQGSAVSTTYGSGTGVTFIGNANVIPTTNPTNGIVAYVDSTDNYFKYRRANGQTVVIDGNAYHNSFLTQSDWYIDPSSGSDSNVGTSSGTALQTFAELKRRWGVGGTLSPSGFTTTIHILGNLSSTDPVSVRDIILGADVSLIIKGLGTTTRGGNFTSTTSFNRSTNQPWSVTDTIIVGTWTTDLTKRLRIVGGAHSGAQAWVLKDLGSKTARTSSWIQLPTVGGDIDPTFISVASPDAYVVETLTQIYLDEVSAGSNSGTGAPSISFVDLDIRTPSFSLPSINSGTATIFYGCFLRVQPSIISNQNIYFIGCYLNEGLYCGGGSFTFIQSGTIVGSDGNAAINVTSGASLSLDFDVLCQGISVSVDTAGTLMMGLVSVFDTTGDAIKIYGKATVDNFGVSGSPVVWGSNNTGYGIKVFEGGQVNYSGTATSTFYITGNNGNFSLGETNITRAWNEKQAKYTHFINPTWNNLATLISVGGFSGSAHNLEQNAAIVNLSPPFVIPDIEITDGYLDGYIEVGQIIPSNIDGQVVTTVDGYSVWADPTGTSALTVLIVGTSTLLSSGDIHVACTSGSITITLPASPTSGEYIEIKDTNGNAGTNNITVNGNGKTIDGSGSVLLINNYVCLSVRYANGGWSIL